ncbi:MAG: hypothetical protein A2516_08695 [Alphaproteobacteria bacterium RIFOXYD12_FULL_60_8]|nr:MAG: hypothetical protein A2516_08695 [Alphaproteobacteria bacterium RIFOXYD12_FULL_60_8]
MSQSQLIAQSVNKTEVAQGLLSVLETIGKTPKQINSPSLYIGIRLWAGEYLLRFPSFFRGACKKCFERLFQLLSEIVEMVLIQTDSGKQILMTLHDVMRGHTVQVAKNPKEYRCDKGIQGSHWSTSVI